MNNAAIQSLFFHDEHFSHWQSSLLNRHIQTFKLSLESPLNPSDPEHPNLFGFQTCLDAKFYNTTNSDSDPHNSSPFSHASTISCSSMPFSPLLCKTLCNCLVATFRRCMTSSILVAFDSDSDFLNLGGNPLPSLNDNLAIQGRYLFANFIAPWASRACCIDAAFCNRIASICFCLGRCHCIITSFLFLLPVLLFSFILFPFLTFPFFFPFYHLLVSSCSLCFCVLN